MHYQKNTSMLRLLTQYLLAISLAVACGASHATDDYIVASALYEDQSAVMTFDEVRTQTLVPAGTFISKGYTRSAFWLRLTIDPTRRGAAEAGKQDKLYVRVQPPYLDDVRLYDPAYPFGHERVNGDHYPWSESEIPSVNFVFAIPAGSQQRDIWVRMRTTSTNMLRVQVLDEKSLALAEKSQDSLAGIFLGLMLILVMWPAMIWVSDRDLLSGLFVLKQGVIFLHALAIIGYWRMLLSSFLAPIQIDFTCTMMIVGFGLSSVIFHYFYFLQFDVRRWVTLWLQGMMLVYVPCLLFLFAGDIYTAVRINTACLGVLSLSFIIVPPFGIRWHAMRQPIISFPTMMTIHVIIFVVAWIFVLPALGIFATTSFAPYIGLFYGAISGFLFLLVLKHRNRMIRESRFMEFAKVEANLQAEKNKREEQSKFLYMLTHEIKTSLSVIRIAFGSDAQYNKYRGHVSEAISDISDVIDRTLIVDKFDAAQIEVCKQWMDLALLVREQAMVSGVVVQSEPAVEIHSDPNLIRRIVVNLIDNALKYGDAESPVTVLLSEAGAGTDRSIRLAVQNKIGPVGAPDPARVFEKYYRAPHAHVRTGSGLGLYLVRHLAELLGGSVRYHPQPGHVIFELTLPVSSGDTRPTSTIAMNHHE